MNKVTAEDIRKFATTNTMDPYLVRYKDEGTISVVPGPHMFVPRPVSDRQARAFGDIECEILLGPDGLDSIDNNGTIDWSNPSREDCEAAAHYLNHYLDEYEYDRHIEAEITRKSDVSCEVCGDPVGTPGARRCPDCEGYEATDEERRDLELTP